MKDKLSKLLPFIKEPIRLLILGIISFAIVELSNVQNPDQWMVMLLLVLRIADKWLHDIGKAVDSNQLTKSITRI